MKTMILSVVAFLGDDGQKNKRGYSPRARKSYESSAVADILGTIGFAGLVYVCLLLF